MQGLMHLLEQALARSQWQDSFAATPAPVEEGTSGDDEQNSRRPRYLN